MKFWFDCEFTGLHKDTSLISIGVVAENNLQFYAELSDFDQKQISEDLEWFEKNVFKNTMRVDSSGNFSKPEGMFEMGVKGFKGNEVVFGDRLDVKNSLLEWLKRNGATADGTVEFVSDVCHYDMALLIDLLTDGGTALDLPSWISPQCYDINQDIAWYYHISGHEAFNMDREFIVKDLDESFSIINFPEVMKHNAVWDATVIQAIYRAIFPRRYYISSTKTNEED